MNRTTRSPRTERKATDRRNIVRLGALLVSALIFSACSSGSNSAPATTVVATTAAPAAPAQLDCGDPVASYQPTFALPAPGQMPSDTYLKTIQDRGHLIVGTASDVLQFSYRNPLTGELAGFDIDVAHAIAKAIFGDPNKIEYKIINYAQRIPSILDGSVDIVADTMTINCNRWAQIAFSTEYYHAGQKVLVRQDSPATTIDAVDKLGGQRICVAKGSTNLDNIKPYTGITRVEVDDLTDCLVLFQQGAADGISADDTVLAGFAKQDPYAKVIGDAFTNEPYGIGSSLAHPELTEFINLVFEQMRSDGTFTALNKTWIDPTKTVDPPKAVYGRKPVTS